MVKPTKPVVYVSSTFIDLKEHRQVLRQALEQSGYNVEAMERYAAFDQPPLDRCLQDVADCDFYVLLLAHRYGFRPEVDGKKTLSITEREYLHACECGKPRLVFCVEEGYPWPPPLHRLQERQGRPQSRSPSPACQQRTWRSHLHIARGAGQCRAGGAVGTPAAQPCKRPWAAGTDGVWVGSIA